jgi:hypothetical protein
MERRTGEDTGDASGQEDEVESLASQAVVPGRAAVGADCAVTGTGSQQMVSTRAPA